MFLRELKEEHKKLFLEFAYKLASIDNDFSDSEKSMMEAYCLEMGIPIQVDGFSMKTDLIIAQLNDECSMEEKKAILFEVIGLAMVDGNYDDDERQLISKLEEAFQIKNDFTKKCENLIANYVSLQAELVKVVHGN